MADAGCINIDEPNDIIPETLGRIASYYYLFYETGIFWRILPEKPLTTVTVLVEHFDKAITDASSVMDLLSVLCDAPEYDELPVRHNEELLNGTNQCLKLWKRQPVCWLFFLESLSEELQCEDEFTAFDDPHVKANLLLRAHFSRHKLPISDYVTDTKSVLDQAIRILQVRAASAGDSMFYFCDSFYSSVLGLQPH